MDEKANTINVIINELKRLQIEHGDVSVIAYDGLGEQCVYPAWPEFNKEKNRIEF